GERVNALKLLENFPTADAADLVYVTLLDDRADEVRHAAVGFLTSLRDRNDVTDKVLQRLTSSTRKDKMDIRAVGALKALAGSEEDDLQNRILRYLDEILGSPQADQFLLHAMIDEQAEKGDAEDSLRMLMLFTRSQYFEKNFGFRRCVVQGLMQVKDLDAITHLINLLPRFKGLVQFDVVNHLIATTGQNFGDDAGKWTVWWAQNRGQLQQLDKSKMPPVGNYGKFGEYYGIPICAKRIVFVLDTSGSMRGAKLDAAKAELIRAVKELPKEVHFSLVIFNGVVRVWQRELVAATESMKQIAVNVVLEQEARSNTASYDALEAAFDLNPEAIYFLSDGAPRGGKIESPPEIVSTISGVNRVRRVSIHSIGIDTSVPGAAIFARFMKSLADVNWGVYHPVN
ncbi:MAG TPA: VWA domain-containing protein, partial [Planctomycetaceae bacterium]|nr:VWA domain-containing protein [Planctomycetaceae bacterium]